MSSRFHVNGDTRVSSGKVDEVGFDELPVVAENDLQPVSTQVKI